MAKVQLSITVDIEAGDDPKKIQETLNGYFLTSSGVKYLHTEYSKTISMVKTACSKFLKKK